MAGEIVHLELPSRSFERSASFYNKLFGWRTHGVQSGGHLLFEAPSSADGAASGSFVLAALAQAPGPLPFVAVDDVDATLAEAERQGGRILVRRLALAGQGEFGLFADPDGNVMAVLAGGARSAGASGGAGGAGEEAGTSASGGGAGAAPGAGGSKPGGSGGRGAGPAEAKAEGGRSKAAPKATAKARSGDSSRSTASRPRPAAAKKPPKGGKR